MFNDKFFVLKKILTSYFFNIIRGMDRTYYIGIRKCHKSWNIYDDEHFVSGTTRTFSHGTLLWTGIIFELNVVKMLHGSSFIYFVIKKGHERKQEVDSVCLAVDRKNILDCIYRPNAPKRFFLFCFKKNAYTHP